MSIATNMAKAKTIRMTKWVKVCTGVTINGLSQNKMAGWFPEARKPPNALAMVGVSINY
jgi:hypothetical protein